MQIPATIDELIDWGKKQEISYRNLHKECILADKQSGDNIKIPLNDVLTDYRYFLQPYTISITLNDDELAWYRFSPKKLSDTLYGTTEYWYVLLALNNCVSKIDFNKKNLVVLDPKTITPFINEVMVLENILE